MEAAIPKNFTFALEAAVLVVGKRDSQRSTVASSTVMGTQM